MSTGVKRAGAIVVVLVVVFFIVKYPAESAGVVNSFFDWMKGVWDKLLSFLNSLGG